MNAVTKLPRESEPPVRSSFGGLFAPSDDPLQRESFPARSSAGITSCTALYQIGEIPVLLRTELQDVLHDFDALYGYCGITHADGEKTVHMEVRAERLGLWRRKSYVISGDGAQLFRLYRRSELLPGLEWGINSRVIARFDDYLQLHAASVAYQGRGVILAGTSGVGKSTLTAGLLARGCKYFCDEITLIEPGTLLLRAFPKAINLKSGSFETVRELNLPLARECRHIKKHKGPVGFLSPRAIEPLCVADPCPVCYVIFPHYTESVKPCLRPVTRTQAAFRLTGCALNRAAFGVQAPAILTEIVRHAQCYSLETGDLQPSCELLESLLRT